MPNLKDLAFFVIKHWAFVIVSVKCIYKANRAYVIKVFLIHLR